jgi:hypothetical protein
MNPFGAYL